jgi:hypothetical protein
LNLRLIDRGWSKELETAARADTTTLRFVCPFIKTGALQRFLSGRRPDAIQVITRFNLNDFAEGASDIGALRLLLNSGAEVRGVRNLHAKLYIFGSSRAIVTSANLTQAALDRNQELGFASDDASIIETCRAYFERLWARGATLSADELKDWDETVTRYLASGAAPWHLNSLGDHGADAGIPVKPPMPPSPVADVRQAFVKFLGEGDNRVPLSFQTIQQLDQAGCHWALAYPASKRPRGVEDGAVMFISRLTGDPNDIRVFGRAIGLRHIPGRDDATAEDIARRPWKVKWPCYVRVHHGEFVKGDMANGVSLYELMDSLGSDAFTSTQRNAARGQGNIDPRRAYMQQAAVELTSKGIVWLSERLEEAFRAHGTLTGDDLAKLDWPKIP